MAVQRPRTATKRKSSVRVAKKKQGVNKKQALILVAVLAVIGVVAVVASQAATAANVYVNNGTTSLLITNSSGAQKRLVPLNGYYYADTLVLSRDKTKLLIGKYQDSNSTLIEKDTGKVIKELTGTGGTNSGFTFMPGDTSILADGTTYTSTDWYQKLKKINLSSGAKTPFTIGSAKNQFHPNISKDGKKIVFAASYWGSRDGYYDNAIITANVNGSGAKIVHHTGMSATRTSFGRPEWSTDGRKISYYADTQPADSSPRTVQLRVMNADGSGDKALATVVASADRSGDTSSDAGQYILQAYSSQTGPDNAHDTWSSGSSAVVFKRITPGHVENLFTIDVNTGVEKKVTSNTSPNTVIGYYGVTADNRVVYSYGPRGGAGNLYGKQTKVVSVLFAGSGNRLIYSDETRPVRGLTWD